MAPRIIKTGFDRLLRAIGEKQDQLVAVRREVNDRRSRFVPPSAFHETDLDDRARAEVEQDALDALDAAAAKLAAEVEELWAKAASLQDAAGRLPGSDEELEAEIVALEQRRKRLDQEHRGKHAEDAHDVLDGMLAIVRERQNAFLAGPIIGPYELDGILATWALRDPELATLLHATVDRRQDFAPGTRDQYRAQVDLLERQAERRRRELTLRIEERAVAEAEQERQQAEARLAALEA